MWLYSVAGDALFIEITVVILFGIVCFWRPKR